MQERLEGELAEARATAEQLAQKNSVLEEETARTRRELEQAQASAAARDLDHLRQLEAMAEQVEYFNGSRQESFVSRTLTSQRRLYLAKRCTIYTDTRTWHTCIRIQFFNRLHCSVRLFCLFRIRPVSSLRGFPCVTRVGTLRRAGPSLCLCGS